MSKDLFRLIAVAALVGLTGCYSMVPQWQLRQSQLRSHQFYNQNRMLAGELGQSQAMASQLAMEKSRLEQDLAVANSRLNNLAQERTKLHDQYKHLLTSLPAPGNPLNSALSRMLEDLCRRYPQFDFDPVTGVCRFHDDLLFSTGSNQIRQEGLKLLQEFAKIMTSSDASQFEILVVGHTDDVPIVKPATRSQHETNWELSAHRATAVVRQLARFGVAEPRMGVAGYSLYHPNTPNTNESARQRNRRAEIYILPPSGKIAGRETRPQLR